MWKDLESIANSINLPWLCAGDFNEIMFSNEKLGGRVPIAHRMNFFRSTMHNCGLEDLGFSGMKFTWFNRRKKRPIFERLDRILANANWLSLFPDYNVTHLPRSNLF